MVPHALLVVALQSIASLTLAPALAERYVPPKEITDLEQNCVVSIGKIAGRARKICHPGTTEKLLPYAEYEKQLADLKKRAEQDGLGLEQLGRAIALNVSKCEREFVDKLLTSPLIVENKENKAKKVHINWADAIIFKSEVHHVAIKEPEILLNTNPMAFGSGGVTLILPEHKWCNKEAHEKVIESLVKATEKWEALVRASSSARKNVKKLGDALSSLGTIFRVLDNQAKGCPEPVEFAQSQVFSDGPAMKPGVTRERAIVAKPSGAKGANAPGQDVTTMGESELRARPDKALELARMGMPEGLQRVYDQMQEKWKRDGIEVTPFEIKTPNGSLGPDDLAPIHYTAGGSESATRTMDEMNAKNARIAEKLGISVQSLGGLQYNQMMIQHNFLTAYRDFHPLPDDQGYFIDTNGHISVAYMAPGCAWNPRLRSMECNFGGSPPAQLPAK